MHLHLPHVHVPAALILKLAADLANGDVRKAAQDSLPTLLRLAAEAIESRGQDAPPADAPAADPVGLGGDV